MLLDTTKLSKSEVTRLQTLGIADHELTMETLKILISNAEYQILLHLLPNASNALQKVFDKRYNVQMKNAAKTRKAFEFDTLKANQLVKNTIHDKMTALHFEYIEKTRPKYLDQLLKVIELYSN